TVSRRSPARQTQSSPPETTPALSDSSKPAASPVPGAVLACSASPLGSETLHCSEEALAAASLVSNLLPQRREVGLRLRHWEIGLADLVVSRFRRGADVSPDSLEVTPASRARAMSGPLRPERRHRQQTTLRVDQRHAASRKHQPQAAGGRRGGVACHHTV